MLSRVVRIRGSSFRMVRPTSSSNLQSGLCGHLLLKHNHQTDPLNCLHLNLADYSVVDSKSNRRSMAKNNRSEEAFMEDNALDGSISSKTQELHVY